MVVDIRWKINSILCFKLIGIHGLCNCELSKPWKKVKEGQQRFSSILNRVLSSSEDVKEEELVDDLITLLKDKTP